MPTFAEIAKAAISLASDLGPECSFSKFHWTVDNALRKPQDWGFPARYAGGMNWNMATLAPEVAGVLWRKPTHPSRIPKQWRALPFKTLVKLLWDGDSPLSLWTRAGTGTDSSSSRAEANEWLEQIAANRRYGGNEWRTWEQCPEAWIIRHFPAGTATPRSRGVARWMSAKKDWGGWKNPVEIGFGPDGEMQTVIPLEMIDEINDDDLVNGVKTNPMAVFRRVIARTSTDQLRMIAQRNLPFPTMPWNEIPGVEQIRCEKDLVAEGERMDHCVAGYADRCRGGRTFILRLPNSTAEVLPDGHVYQHRGRSNTEPSAADTALLNRWVGRCVTGHAERQQSIQSRQVDRLAP